MSKVVFYSFSLFMMIISSVNGEEGNTLAADSRPDSSNKDVATISEAFGHLIGKNLESLGFEFDIQSVVQGLKDASSGKSSPLSEVECIQAITSIQEAVFKDQCKSNLSVAEDFLKKNKKVKNIVSIEKGKVQYKIEKQGNGPKLENNLAPVIRYVGKFADGTIFGESKEDEHISLEEMIPGLRQGMSGMKEGEKRTIYIHPDLAYGTKGSLPPNSLLTFEIELVKVDAPMQMEHAEGTQKALDPSLEIAFPAEESYR
ncbi:MAG: FKBP-type peptidyl-prolyl cis-trans isomerase [Chlamydiae bacterium]|nr:FKBP-type peptidyl-prolyl cis-trans isomerase [Chlamydiota bacterium]